jgi:ankyrin repeat protein
VTGDTGDTALHLAAANGHTEVVKMLLLKGADVNLTNKARPGAHCSPRHRVPFISRDEGSKYVG